MQDPLPPLSRSQAYEGPAGLDVITLIQELFEGPGRAQHEADWPGPVSGMEHALQCAQFAEWADAPAPLVAAALLHDIGHLLVPAGEPGRGDDNAHELRALGLLGTAFGRDVLEPIRLHVQAKRYLAASDERYRASLSRVSTLSLWRQGGPMTPAQAQEFEELPWAAQAVALRRWDDAALTRAKPTPSLAYYLDLLESLRRPAVEPRTALGPTDIC